jgi:hypothetical protein
LTAGRRAKPVSDEIQSLADQITDRILTAREYHVHSRQAWRLVQQLNAEDSINATGRDSCAIPERFPRATRWESMLKADEWLAQRRVRAESRK